MLKEKGKTSRQASRISTDQQNIIAEYFGKQQGKSWLIGRPFSGTKKHFFPYGLLSMHLPLMMQNKSHSHDNNDDDDGRRGEAKGM